MTSPFHEKEVRELASAVGTWSGNSGFGTTDKPDDVRRPDAV